MTDLGTLGGMNSYANAINSNGETVGYSWKTGVLGDYAFLYNDGLMTDLNTLIDPTSGWTLESAQAINDNGWIAGYGIGPDGQTQAFLLTPVPEPATLALTVVGLAGLVRFRNRLVKYG